MARWFTSLFFLIVLVGSLSAGTTFSVGGMKENVCPMKCCKKMANAVKPQERDAKFLCRTLICSQNLPTNTANNVPTNFAPVLIVSEKATLFEILFSTRPKEDAKTFNVKDFRLKTNQPKYIQYQSFLI